MTRTKPMLTVGITGRSGSGKSLLAAQYAQLGYPVADGDAISRDVTQPGSACLAQLVEAFGPQILAPDGRLLRGQLAQQAFASEAAAKRLVDITHPYIVRELLRRRDAAQAAGTRLFFIDGAVIVGAPAQEYCDKLIVVVAEHRLSISRVILREGISKTTAATRLSRQLPEETLRAAADYVIENNGSEEALRQQGQAVLEKLLAL